MEGVEVHLGLGSNLDDRRDNLLKGLKALSRRIKLTKVSSIYETEPWGYTDQPAFLNCVCAGITLLTPKGVLAVLKETETLVGRKPTFPGGPRIFDADLLFYGQAIVEKPHLQVPHPRLAERAFVLVPLAEIASQHIHPIESQTVQELVGRVEGRKGVRLWGPPPRWDLALEEV